MPFCLHSLTGTTTPEGGSEMSVTPKGITHFFMASLCGLERNEQVWLANGLRSWKENAERGP